MRSLAAAGRDLLATRGHFAPGGETLPLGRIAALIALGCAGYGFGMGAFSLRWEQCFISALKLPLLIAVATVVSLPSFFVFNTVLGLRDDFADACRAVFCAQATMALCLLGFAPLIAVVYLTTSDYALALYYHGLPFLASTIGAQVTLSRHYGPLLARDPRHRITRGLWLLVYVFVAIQCAWILRPFVGAPTLAPEFLRDDAWSNAYVRLAEGISKVFGF